MNMYLDRINEIQKQVRQMNPTPINLQESFETIFEIIIEMNNQIEILKEDVAGLLLENRQGR